MPTRGRLRSFAAALLFAVAATGVFAAAAQAVPARFWGVVPQATPSFEQLQRLQRGGVDSLRIPVGWDSAQPVSGGAFDWSGVDSRIEEATQAGLEVLPFLSSPPSWAVRQVWVPGSHHGATAPVGLPVAGAAARGWSAFVMAAVQRYGPGGSFWAEHPTLPQHPIRVWQIWNEENFKYFVARPNPAEYGKLVRISFHAIDSVDPGAKLLLGGMFAQPREALWPVRPRQAYFAADFLNRLYQSTPGIKNDFAGVALHPYTPEYQRLTPQIEEVRSVLKRNHDARKTLWITELGWSSEPPSPGDSFAKGPAGQARQLRGAFRLLERGQVKWRLARVFWFSVADYFGVCNFCGGSGLFTGSFVPKPSWYAYVRFAGGQP